MHVVPFNAFEWQGIPGHAPSTIWMVKAFQGMSPQQLNDKAFQSISPQQLNDEHSRAWALNKVWVWNWLDLCISAYNSTTTTNMHNQLWHTPPTRSNVIQQLTRQNSSTWHNSHKSIQSIYQEVFIRFSAYTEVIQHKINILERSEGSPNARNENQKVADKSPARLSEGLLAWATKIT